MFTSEASVDVDRTGTSEHTNSMSEFEETILEEFISQADVDISKIEKLELINSGLCAWEQSSKLSEREETRFKLKRRLDSTLAALGESSKNSHKAPLFASSSSVTASNDLSSYLYLYGLIHDTSLIILLTICTTRPFLLLASSHAACVNVYRTYPLSRYLAVHYLTPQRVLSHLPSYSVGYSHAYITHPG
jgi:hypothetical protein